MVKTGSWRHETRLAAHLSLPIYGVVNKGFLTILFMFLRLG
jgi:hypothetical protein